MTTCPKCNMSMEEVAINESYMYQPLYCLECSYCGFRTPFECIDSKDNAFKFLQERRGIDYGNSIF